MHKLKRAPACRNCSGAIAGRGRMQLCARCAETHRYCRRCDQVKPLEAFTLPGGRVVRYCYECMRAYQRERNKLPQTKRMYYINHLRNKHGITKEEAERLADTKQCELCGQPFPSSQQRHVDHCHTTGKVRGVLCLPCNHTVGHFEANLSRLDDLLAYIAR